jgi:hypothetical protein
MPWWVRVWSRIPVLERYARNWMWSHGGYLVLPPDHPLLGRYSPEEYEALTGITKAEYERRCLAAAREAFAEERKRFTNADVTIDGDDLVARFGVVGRPERFGMRLQLWPAPHPDDYEGEPEWSELLPTFAQASLDSPYRDIPEADANGVTWLSDY